MTTLLFLLLLLLALQALGRGGRTREPAGSWSEAGRRLARDALAGVRALSRLAAARRDRVGSPWS